jgi:hypothetical protein
MAHARQDIPALIEEVERLRAALAMARGEIKRCQEQMSRLTVALMRLDEPEASERRSMPPPEHPAEPPPSMRGRHDLW